jgi:hypothetical protein
MLKGALRCAKLCAPLGFVGFVLVTLALRHDRGAETSPEIFRQFVKLGAAIDLNGAFRRVANDVAVVTPQKVLVEFLLGTFVDHAVEVIGKLF